MAKSGGGTGFVGGRGRIGIAGGSLGGSLAIGASRSGTGLRWGESWTATRTGRSTIRVVTPRQTATFRERSINQARRAADIFIDVNT